jgi:hypothetical protein
MSRAADRCSDLRISVALLENITPLLLRIIENIIEASLRLIENELTIVEKGLQTSGSAHSH